MRDNGAIGCVVGYFNWRSPQILATHEMIEKPKSLFSCEIVCCALKKTWPANLYFRHCVCITLTGCRNTGFFFAICVFTLRFKTYTSFDYESHYLFSMSTLACIRKKLNKSIPDYVHVCVVWRRPGLRKLWTNDGSSSSTLKKPAQYNIIERTIE